MNSNCTVCGNLLTGQPHLTALVPIFKSEDHIEALFDYFAQLDQLVSGGIEVVCVVDGSPDESERLIRDRAKTSTFKVTLLVLSRNFGVGPALHAGLAASTTCGTVVFGSDLQEPVELFEKFSNLIFTGNADVCLGHRISRDDPLSMRFFSAIYWWINRKFLDNDTPKGGFDVFGISMRAKEALLSLPELNTNFTSQLQWIGFTRVYISFDRRARLSGKSSWTFKKKFKLFADSIFGFSSAPVSLIFGVGLSLSIGASAIGFVTLLGALLGRIDVPGYATLIILTAFGQGATLSSIGILGGYLSRTFDNSKRRPRYIVMSSETLGN